MSPELLDLRRVARLKSAGGKARALARLQQLGFAVPDAWVLTPERVRRLSGDPVRYASAVIEALDPSFTYAVRSSAASEDHELHSFAGRFTTKLDVAAGDVAAAVVEVGTTATGEALDSYADAVGTERPKGEIGVIVQRMVQPRAAGVVFSRNPVTGIKETVIEAARGTADRLVAGVVRPERWVRKRGVWLVVPDEPVLPSEVAERIADGAERLERAFGRPIDAEWAWDGELWWLQARPITAGNQAAVYSSKLARDMLPGIILPFVWSINGPLNSGAFVRFLEDVFGPLGVKPEDLSTLFHYRMYVNIGCLSALFAEFGLPEESLELLAGMERGASMPRMPRPTVRSLGRVPHVTSALWRFSRFERELEAALPGLETEVRRFVSEEALSTSTAEELLARLERLTTFVAELSYYHLVTLMIMQMRTMRLRSALERSGAIGAGETLQLPCAESAGDDFAGALTRLGERLAHEPASVRRIAHAGDLSTLRSEPSARDFAEAFDEFLSEFGHLSDSGVNFSAVPWSEQPDAALRMIALQSESDSARPAALNCDDFEHEHRLRGSRARALRKAVLYQALRDRTSALYTYAYGQFRPHALALGRHLEVVGALGAADEVFYLSLEEVERVVQGTLRPEDARALVLARGEEVALAEQGEPPETVVGEVAELVRMPQRRVLRGTPTSRGRYTGRVVVCRSISDLPRIGKGDVVVVPFSDASWTPLFSRAGAVVAESGGVLSHSAILARELGLPAIVSVRGALALVEGSLVSVDGFEGTVTVVKTAS